MPIIVGQTKHHVTVGATHQDAAERPDVDLEVVLHPEDDLRRPVGPGLDVGPEVVRDVAGRPEVDDLDVCAVDGEG